MNKSLNLTDPKPLNSICILQILSDYSVKMFNIVITPLINNYF